MASAPGQFLIPQPDIVFTAPAGAGAFGWSASTDGTVIAGLCSTGVAIYARTGVAPTWVLQGVAPMPAGNEVAVAVDGERLVATEWFALAYPQGVAQVFRRSGSEWIEEAVLAPQPGPADDSFGGPADIDGDTLVLAGSRDGAGGCVFVFTRGASGWSQRAAFAAGDTLPGDQFGCAVALDDGVLVVGAQAADVAGAVDAGAAYVFTGCGADWTQQAKLAGPAPGGSFGYAVAVDGDTVLVGAPTADTPAAPRAGAAYVFARSGGSWTLQGILASPIGESDDLAGFSVALDGDRAISGAPWASDPFGTPLAGAAQRYTRQDGIWSYWGAYQSPDPGGYGTNLGGAVSLGADSVVAVAPGPPTATLHVFLEVPLYIDMPTWLDLGYGLAGVAGVPRLSGSGTLQAGSPGELLLEQAAPDAPVLGLIALAQTPMPFKGGTLVPLPVQSPIFSSTSGSGIWRAHWNALPGGIPLSTPFYVQFAVADAAAPNGVALSNALAGITH
ncbi:MAG TPA: hypothetical protein VFD43_12660 [Planctomycetota bacterium]|nr:hypothetical protein [Planctomycetota bacterium]